MAGVRRMNRLPTIALVVGTLALLAIVVVAAARAEAAAPHERSCDGKAATFHVKRAKALIADAYREERWADSSPAKDREKRAWQEHKRCVRDAELRERIEDYRDKRQETFDLYRRYRVAAPFPGPNGTWWAIPWWIVSCESYGGRWDVVSYAGALGAYQLLNWPVPWPVNSFADQVAHHEMAAYLWANYGASKWDCAV